MNRAARTPPTRSPVSGANVGLIRIRHGRRDWTERFVMPAGLPDAVVVVRFAELVQARAELFAGTTHVTRDGDLCYLIEVFPAREHTA